LRKGASWPPARVVVARRNERLTTPANPAGSNLPVAAAALNAICCEQEEFRMTWSDSTGARLGATGLLPVVTIERPDDAVPLARALLAGGIGCAEITLRTAAAAEAIGRIAAEEPAFLVGAGTVLTVEQAEAALAAGARFAVPAAPVGRVVDPVGAGDGFDAGFLAAWLRGETLEAMLRLGARIGAAAVSVVGDYAGYPRG
jgi:hypothetical protein